MKKFCLPGFSLLLVLTLLVSVTGSAVAAPLGSGPVVSSPSGGGTVTTTIVPVEKLPGTATNDIGDYFPVGHENGDLEFSGDGVQVSGLVGYATLSMPLVNFAYGWNGSIYQWLDGKWTLLPTTVTQNAESNDGTASATIYSDGIYVLIVSYKQPANSGDGMCSKVQSIEGEYTYFYFGENVVMLSEIVITGTFPQDWIKEGTTITLHTSYTPEEGNLNGTAAITDVFSPADGVTAAMAQFDKGNFAFAFPGEELPDFTLQVKVNGCKFNMHFPEDFEETGGGVD